MTTPAQTPLEKAEKALEVIHGQAHSGAMLGISGKDAYEAFLKIEAACAEALSALRASTGMKTWKDFMATAINENWTFQQVVEAVQADAVANARSLPYKPTTPAGNVLGELEDLIPKEWRLVHLEQEQPSLWVCRIGLRIQFTVAGDDDAIVSIQMTGQTMREAVLAAVEKVGAGK